MNLISWNVNGIRACAKKGFCDWLIQANPDICLIQETKAHAEQLDEEVLNPPGYQSHWYSAKRKGYSSVAVYVKNNLENVNIETGIGIKEFDDEGRVQAVIIDRIIILNCYFPNSRHDLSRLDYKIAFDTALLDFANEKLKQGFQVIICGDYNVAHKPIDLKNPKANVKNPGFLPEEREWMTKFLANGYIDTFRHFYPDLKDQYTWWSYRLNAREKNIGWRIDYFCVNKGFIENVLAAGIQADIMGSDHCPVSLHIKLD